MTQIKRESFSGNFTTFFATLSAAVGLGNIWRFPYVIGENGGAAFLLIYFACVFLIGFPILIAEFIIGRSGQGNVVAAYEKIGGPRWKFAGFMAIASSMLIAFFYTSVTGWTYYYLYKSLTRTLVIENPTAAHEVFTTFVNNPTSNILWQWIAIAVAAGVICLGVRKGIERLTKFSMPLLFILMILCMTQSLSLPNSWAGVEFLFKVDFSKVSQESWLTALGLAFFKISLGTGAMLTYSSYFKSEVNLVQSVGRIVIADTLISILAGLVIFPAVFSFGIDPSSGPGLLFETIPLVFDKMPFGGVLTTVFFFLAASAATSVTIALFEPFTSYLIGNWGLSRKKATLFVVGLNVFFGAFAALSPTPNSLLGDFHLFGKTFFNLFDFMSSNLMMPLGGLFCALIVGWRVSSDLIKKELTNDGYLRLGHFFSIYMTIIRYVTPILVAVVFFNAF